MLPEQVTDVSTFQPKPGEAILAHVIEAASVDSLHGIGEQLRRLWPDNQIIVLRDGIGLETLDDEQLAAAGLTRA